MGWDGFFLVVSFKRDCIAMITTLQVRNREIERYWGTDGFYESSLEFEKSIDRSVWGQSFNIYCRYSGYCEIEESRSVRHVGLTTELQMTV